MFGRRLEDSIPNAGFFTGALASAETFVLPLLALRAVGDKDIDAGEAREAVEGVGVVAAATANDESATVVVDDNVAP